MAANRSYSPFLRTIYTKEQQRNTTRNGMNKAPTVPEASSTGPIKSISTMILRENATIVVTPCQVFGKGKSEWNGLGWNQAFDIFFVFCSFSQFNYCRNSLYCQIHIEYIL